MATVVRHRQTNIVILEEGEAIEGHCGPGDIAISAGAGGWWNSFVDAHGAVDSYDIPYPSYKEALWAAKAAAEFGVL